MAQLNPGPQITDLLHSNDEHRASRLFNGSIPLDRQLMMRRSDREFWEFVPRMPETVRYFVREAGFGGIIRVGNRKIDHALITTLVERWRPETHTFHFPIGEATVTLQDVQVLWDFRVDGNVVTDTDTNLSVNELMWKCQELMGFTPNPAAIIKCAIKLSCLFSEMQKPLPDEATVDDITKKARFVIMHLLGGTIVPNSSGNLVYLYHLDNLVDLQESGHLSWESAILACLYRRLCKASKYRSADVSGPLGLLQLWAWERIQSLAPTLVSNNYNFGSPYGARWSTNNSQTTFSRVTSHVLAACRSLLTSLTINEFNWTPYSEEVLNRLPSYCTSGRATWTCETYIVYWEIAETHLPSRVMRQFGMFQAIPDMPLFDHNDHLRQHRLSRIGKTNHNWEQEHQYFIQYWHNRHAHIQNGNHVPNFAIATDEYMSWYL